jgi:hypothetical protein
VVDRMRRKWTVGAREFGGVGRGLY